MHKCVYIIFPYTLTMDSVVNSMMSMQRNYPVSYTVNSCYNICFYLLVNYKFVAGVPGVISVRPDESFDSDDKDYRGILMSFIF